MTVKELREWLKQFPEDTEIQVLKITEIIEDDEQVLGYEWTDDIRTNTCDGGCNLFQAPLDKTICFGEE